MTALDASVAIKGPDGLVFGCFDIGDNDFETGIGGGFFLIDAAPDHTGEGGNGLANIVLGLLSTGLVDLFGCASPHDFVSGAGATPEVVIADAFLPPNGAPFAVCYDGNGDGTCLMNVAATIDAWDQCQAEGWAQAVATEVLASPLWGDGNSAPNTGSPYDTVAERASFFGVSIDGTDCKPNKGGPLGVPTAAGPNDAAIAAPSVAALEAATGDPTIDFTYLMVFTSVYAEFSGFVSPFQAHCGFDFGPSFSAVGAATEGWILLV